jgi:hypothetical protein
MFVALAVWAAIMKVLIWRQSRAFAPQLVAFAKRWHETA